MWYNVLLSAGDTLRRALISQTLPYKPRNYSVTMECYVDDKFNPAWLADYLLFARVVQPLIVFTEPVRRRNPIIVCPDGLLFTADSFFPFVLGSCPKCDEHPLPMPFLAVEQVRASWAHINSPLIATAIERVLRNGYHESTLCSNEASIFAGYGIKCESRAQPGRPSLLPNLPEWN